MNSHVHYLHSKWKHYLNNEITDEQMFFLIIMISERTKINFIDLLIMIQKEYI